MCSVRIVDFGLSCFISSGQDLTAETGKRSAFTDHSNVAVVAAVSIALVVVQCH
jgi:hypothetical protein